MTSSDTEPGAVRAHLDAARESLTQFPGATRQEDRAGLADAVRGELDALQLHAENLERAASAAGDADAGFVARIAAAMREAEQVTKSSTNTDQGYKFASAESILAAVRLPLLKRGIILTAQPRNYDEQTITSRGGSQGTRVLIDVDYTFRDDEHTLVIEAWRGDGQDFGDKAYGKAYTNAIKTFIRGQWLLPTEHDDPEGSPSGERVAAARQPAAPTFPAADAGLVAAAEESLARLFRDTDTVTEYLSKLAPQLGGSIPAPVAEWLRHFPDWVKVGRERAAAAEQAAKAEQDRAAEAGDPPAPEPAPDPEPPLEEPPPGALTPEDAPVPGSVTVDDLPADPAQAFAKLRAAGCSCADPVAAHQAQTIEEGNQAGVNESCPVHGIPF